MILHHGALNLNPLAIIGSKQIIQQVSDNLDIDPAIKRSKKLIELAKNLSAYLEARNGKLTALKGEIVDKVNTIIKSAGDNGVPQEIHNYMAYQEAQHYAAMQKLLINYEYPMSNVAVNMTTLGKGFPKAEGFDILNTGPISTGFGCGHGCGLSQSTDTSTDTSTTTTTV